MNATSHSSSVTEHYADFSNAVHGAFARLANLRARAAARTLEEDPLILEALAELECAHEELHTAAEELHSQVDALQVTRSALDVEKLRYRELFESAPDAYIATDANGSIEECNIRACELLNINAAFVRRKPISLFIFEHDRSALRDALGTLSHACGENVLLELRVVPRQAPGPRWVSASISRAPGAFGQPHSLRWLLRDVTVAKESAERDEVLKATLAQEVRERTSELEATKQLLQHYLEQEREARALAEQALSQRDRLLATVAHELRTPLNAISGWNQLLVLESTSLSLRERIYTIISRNVDRMTRLIEDLVDHERAERGSLKIERQLIDLMPLLDSALEDHTLAAEIKGVKLTLSAHCEHAFVVGDALRLQQALNNLLGNAFKFTAPGGTVHMDLSCTERDIVITVSDSGRGIASEDLEKVFHAFVQVSGAPSSPGLGLGLSIARHLVKLHGGALTAHSPGLGHGCTFSIVLPVASPET